MAKKDHLTEELNRHFGFGTFKGNQKAIIENVLAGKDTFVLMPTGGGKSLCYQITIHTNGRNRDRDISVDRFDEESGGRDAEFQ